ncbi:hypothetical protein IPP75_00690 [Candidatus Saccharibacteria bacterium]|nr:MAG: hypothetical protein IPP75_00690 [Candidatus Saccharibacteria bacterium]
MQRHTGTAQDVFRYRVDTEPSSIYLQNLRTVIDGHSAIPLAVNACTARLTTYRKNSGIASDRVRTDRTGSQLARAHGISLAALTNFAEGKTVIDIGAGRSDFLSWFRNSRRIALEQDDLNAQYQASAGNDVIAGLALDGLRTLKDATAHVIHDSYASYWTPSQDEALALADEMKRVLAVGGVILSGSVFDEEYHGFCESALRLSSKLGGSFMPPYRVGNRTLDEDTLSSIRMDFYNRLVSDPNYSTVCTRAVNGASPDSPRQIELTFQLPNYIAAIKQAG